LTNKIDNYKERLEKQGEGVESTQGVPVDGFIDPHGEYPKREYFFGSGINKAARGEVVNQLYSGGGDFGVSVAVADQKPSQFPYNQVQETESGHIIEIDDTPGGERILIKHRKGSGIELRSDGSIIFSSTSKKVSITGGDEVIIVEGEASLVYKGNLNLSVSGDYNLDVNGNYNVNVAGDKIEKIKGRHDKVVDKDQNTTIRGARSTYVNKGSNETVFDKSNVQIKGNHTYYVEGSTIEAHGGDYSVSAGRDWTASANACNITGRHVSVIGDLGTFGGTAVEFFGKTYSGPIPGPTATFYGTLVGKAAEAIRADYAMLSSIAVFAVTSTVAGALGTAVPATPIPGILPFLPIIPFVPAQNPVIIEGMLMSTKYGIKPVTVDSKLRDNISLKDEYASAFDFRPNIHEIRSKLRDSQWRSNGKLIGQLISDNALSPEYSKTISPKIGRKANREGTVRFGIELIGNNPVENRSKRFKVQ
jgi:hypothetical protein